MLALFLNFPFVFETKWKVNHQVPSRILIPWTLISYGWCTRFTSITGGYTPTLTGLYSVFKNMNRRFGISYGPIGGVSSGNFSGKLGHTVARATPKDI